MPGVRLINDLAMFVITAMWQATAPGSGLPPSLKQDIDAAAAPVTSQVPPPVQSQAQSADTAVPETSVVEPPATPPPPPRPAPPPSPDVFGMVAVPSLIGLQDERWLRIGMLPSRNPILAAMVRPAFGLTPYQQGSFVQGTVNGKLIYRDDQDNWGLKDYWASADETIARGAGDCEDLAIVKLQALRLLGFNERDLYLMVGTKPSGEEHALLLVRIDERFWVMEDGLTRIIPAESFHAFIPAVALGAGWKWTYSAQARVQGAAPAAAAPRPLP
jgi:predicted transglutaminase-like cysteine proteinase